MKKFLFLPIMAAIGIACAEQPTSHNYSTSIQVTPLLQTSKTAAGQPMSYPVTNNPEFTAILVEIPPGAETGWHKHPFPCYAYMLSGEVSVELESGTVNHFGAGEAFVEVTNMFHNGKNLGSEPAKLVMFVTGEKNKPFTIKRPY